MSEHLPECWGDDPQDMYPQCICKRLRASEQRVTDDFARKERKAAEYGYEQGWNVGHREALRGWKSIEECVADAQRDERDRIRHSREWNDGLFAVLAVIKGGSE
jgi:hypothetical protein